MSSPWLCGRSLTSRSISRWSIEGDLTFLGLIAMMGPPHREVPEAVAKCRRPVCA